MKKLGVQLIAFRENKLIIPAIRQYQGFAKVVVGVSQTPWNSNLKPDNTYELAKSTGVEVYAGNWKTEAEQRNFLMTKLQDVDYVIVLNSDGFLTKESLANINKFIKNAYNDQFGCHTLTYWKNFNTIIQPDWGHNVFLIRKDQRFEFANRIYNYRVNNPIVPGVTVHHVSWVKTNQEILEKIKSYSHADEIIPNWYEEKWLKWTPEMTDFAPTTPTDFKSTMEYRLPLEIKNLIWESVL